MPVSNHKVCALAFHDMPLFEFGIAVELFGLPRPEMGPHWYSFSVAGIDPGPLMTTAGLRIASDGGLEQLETADTLVIAGWPFKKRSASPDLIAVLQSAHARGARIMSICSGAFLLAEAGLLAGRRATTHWMYADDFRERHPDAELVPDVLYVDEGQILTSAGSAAGLDLGLHLIRRDFGAEAANRVACRLVLPAHRDGGQAQFVRRAVPAPHESARLGPLLDDMRARPDGNYRVSDLARRAGMSERTFLRRFSEATGTTPARWLLAARLAQVRDELEGLAGSIDDIAIRAGFGNAANLRHHFREQFGITPSAYRQAFGHGQAAE